MTFGKAITLVLLIAGILMGIIYFNHWLTSQQNTQTSQATTQTGKPQQQGNQSWAGQYQAEQKIIVLQEDIKKLQENCCGKKQQTASTVRRRSSGGGSHTTGSQTETHTVTYNYNLTTTAASAIPALTSTKPPEKDSEQTYHIINGKKPKEEIKVTVVRNNVSIDE